MTIRATHTPTQQSKSPGASQPHACPRCGVVRIARPGSICHDCWAVDRDLCKAWTA